jgi:hypothetical protein
MSFFVTYVRDHMKDSPKQLKAAFQMNQ